jgi:predicted nucleotidyltransferase
MEKNLILKILDETKIINGALEAENVDIVLSALEKRGTLYKEYENLPENEKTILKKSMKNEIDKIGVLDKESLELFKKFDEKLRRKFNRNSVKKAKLKKSETVNKKYRNPYSMISRSRFDAKF